jgi:hypothetical protein
VGGDCVTNASAACLSSSSRGLFIAAIHVYILGKTSFIGLCYAS